MMHLLKVVRVWPVSLWKPPPALLVFLWCCLNNLQKINIVYLFNSLCPCGWLQEIAIWILEVWLTFTEHDSFFHKSYGLSERLINVSNTYYIRIRNYLKTKVWKKFSVMYWRQSVMLSGKTPSTHSHKAGPKWQCSENTHTAKEQDTTAHVSISFHVWHARYTFHYTKHLNVHRRIGTLPLCGALNLLETCINFSPFPLRMHRNLVVVQNPLDV